MPVQYNKSDKKLSYLKFTLEGGTNQKAAQKRIFDLYYNSLESRGVSCKELRKNGRNAGIAGHI